VEGLWPTLIQGDCRDVLKTLESESVHCCVTSPPYWGLRDYGVASQIGLEPTPELWVAALVGVFREVRRVLRKDGILWLNLGDAYASAWPCQRRNVIGTGSLENGKREARPPRLPGGLKDKDLIGLPWRLAFALQADGWWLRSDIIWAKPNPMPESVTDRPTRSHEYLFLLTKSATYFYDADAIRETHSALGRVPGNKSRFYVDRDPQHAASHKMRPSDEQSFHPAGRNRRTVWEIATQPTPEAHFATFPEALVEPGVMAGTSECGCCPECGAPWARVTEKERTLQGNSAKAGRSAEQINGSGKWAGHQEGNKNLKSGPCIDVQTIGWAPTCVHPHREKELQPALVLDPFAGSGTVMRVASRLGRRSIGIELSAEYVETIARKRTAQGSLGL
jgi:DNA modification methylase